ncbi:MAG: Sulfofructosephosphate aldolase [Microbacteriaceae bacterium]|nr:Sulfofructosephosphate aldolase [Microbacteriaceae bacterium]
MTIRPVHAAPSLDTIARPSGALAMVAMDQRESLRTMFDTAGAGRPADDVLVRFKLDVAEALGPLASGFLIDRHFGFDRLRGSIPESTGLILAVDALTQPDGGPVEETALDDAVFDPRFDLGGVAAVKLLIIWRRDELREQRVRLAADFIARAGERGLLSVLEPIVWATRAELDDSSWNADAAIREAARELSILGPSLYKVQVPLAGAGTTAEQAAASVELARSICGPWVVLSQGVAREGFLSAVAAACRAGASGFLAGRALWSDIVGSAHVPAALQDLAVPRLRALVETVDREARPWGQA